MAEDTIDVATLKSLQETAGADFVAELATTFFEEAPQMLATLRAAHAARDREIFRRTAHSLKSNSLTFGATRLAEISRALELDAGSVIARGDSAPLGALADEYARVADALAELTHA